LEFLKRELVQNEEDGSPNNDNINDDKAVTSGDGEDVQLPSASTGEALVSDNTNKQQTPLIDELRLADWIQERTELIAELRRYLLSHFNQTPSRRSLSVTTPLPIAVTTNEQRLQQLERENVKGKQLCAEMMEELAAAYAEIDRLKAELDTRR
jgi:hypothetical protein